jgi:hypothetical protein
MYVLNRGMERPTVRDLYKLLKEAKKDNEYIIEIFVSIIQAKMQSGGDIADSVYYHVEKLKKELHL